MNQFIAEGNVRVMAEMPGVELSTETKPTRAQLDEIARIFRVSTDYLLGCSVETALDASGLTARQISTLQDIIDAYQESNRHKV